MASKPQNFQIFLWSFVSTGGSKSSPFIRLLPINKLTKRILFIEEVYYPVQSKQECFHYLDIVFSLFIHYFSLIMFEVIQL